MSVWFTSDLHLGHKAVIDYCHRPFADVDEMDSHLIEKWNAAVRPDDYVYCLGDLSFHKPSKGVRILSELLGRKILVRGNHDKYSSAQYEAAGFLVFEEVKLKLTGHYVTLSHYPYWEELPPNEKEYEPRCPDKRPANRGGWLLHGHVHDKWESRMRMLNVGVDVRGYQPVSWAVLASFISRAEAMEEP